MVMPYTTLAQLAKEFKTDRSNLRKYLLKKGFKFDTIRVKETSNQKNLALSEKETKRARELRISDGYTVKEVD